MPSRHQFLAATLMVLVAGPVLAGGRKVVTFQKPASQASPVGSSSPETGTPAASPPTAASRNQINRANRAVLGGSAYWLGLQVGPADSTLRSQLRLGDQGLVVREVIAGSPAQTAGFKSDDLLLEVTAKDAKTLLKQRDDLVRVVNAVGVDAPVQVRFLREGKEQTLSATPAKRITGRPAAPVTP